MESLLKLLKLEYSKVIKEKDYLLIGELLSEIKCNCLNSKMFLSIVNSNGISSSHAYRLLKAYKIHGRSPSLRECSLSELCERTETMPQVTTKEFIQDDSLVCLPLKGYEGKYEINKNGEIYKLAHLIHGGIKPRKRMKTVVNKRDNILMIKLNNDEGRRALPVARLVYSTFNPNIKFSRIHHIDEDISNVKLDNLHVTSLPKRPRLDVLKLRAKLIKRLDSKNLSKSYIRGQDMEYYKRLAIINNGIIRRL